MSMDWRTTFAGKIVKADEAAQKVRSGDKVWVSHFLSEPCALVTALMNRAADLEAVEIMHGMTPGSALCVQPGMEKSFIHSSLHLGGAVLSRRNEGHPVRFVPLFFHELPTAMRRGRLAIDVAMVSVSLPDAEGHCSFGLDCAYSAALLDMARIAIVQVNPELPNLGGASFNLRDADWIVEAASPLYSSPQLAPSEIERRIGAHIAAMVEDGATVQCCANSLGTAALDAMRDKNDLGVHSEQLTEKMMELVKLGVINGRMKSLHVGKLVATGLGLGSAEWYRWADRNPQIELYPVDYVNDPAVIGRQTRQVAIQTGLEVDLLGQVNAEMSAGRQVSGIGGTLDFFRGVRRSVGGKSFIALPSTTADGTASRILAGLRPGTAVTVTRNDIDYVVTEYGVASLHCYTNLERIEQLVNIAHPDFRDQLRAQAREMRLR